MEESSLTFQTPTSPRIRPIGPRTRRQPLKNPTTLNLSGGNRSPSDDTVPAYSGRTSPISSGSRPHSPSPPLTSMPSFSQLTETPSHIRDHGQEDPMHVSKAVQTTHNDVQPYTPPSRATTPGVKVILKQPTLEPPPALNFEPTPVQWKGLTLEAAQWTFNAQELQDIVSRAIRKSAAESFIRLLSIKTLDEELSPELDRLEHLKATTQSQYRFNMHRRTMLLQSLVALSAGESDSAALVNLTNQLAEITRSCDRLMESMLRISDQRAQIQRIQDVHDASALAMALRKLNGSYAKRTTELRECRAQMESLKAELEEAWRVAEDMAQEMDDLENFRTGFSETEGEGDAIEAETGDGQTVDIDDSVRLATVMNITGTAVATKATLTNIAEGNASASTIRRTGSDRTPAADKPERQESDRTRRVSAARKRSSRASKASLRLPKSSTTKKEERDVDRASITSKASKRSRSKSMTRRRGTVSNENSPVEPPLVPPVPADKTKPEISRKDDSFLIMSETRPSSPTQTEAVPAVPSLPEAPSVPINENDDSDPDPETSSSRSKRPVTLKFEMPPITITTSEDQPKQTGAGHLLDRRVRSMQPSLPRTRCVDDVGVGLSTSQESSNTNRFDGWPWGSVRNSKRHSMPMTSASFEEAAKDVHENNDANSSSNSGRAFLTAESRSVESAP